MSMNSMRGQNISHRNSTITVKVNGPGGFVDTLIDY